MKYVLTLAMMAALSGNAFAAVVDEKPKPKPKPAAEIQSHHPTHFVVGVVCPKIVVGVCNGTVVDIIDSLYN